MERRTFLASSGLLAAGSAAAVGTGAFTSVTANRSVNVSVANEDQAYLAISPTTDDNGTFANDDSSNSNRIEVDINDAGGVQDPGDGVGLDSVYTFDKVFKIENQGTQPITVSINQLSGSDFNPSESELTVQFYPGTSSGTPLHNNSITLGTGSSRKIGLKVDVDDPSIDDFDADATVSANST